MLPRAGLALSAALTFLVAAAGIVRAQGDSAAWTYGSVQTLSPPPTWGGWTVFDSRRGRFLHHPGMAYMIFDGPGAHAQWFVLPGPVSALAASPGYPWLPTVPDTLLPSAAFGSAVYDSVTDRLLVFGGADPRDGSFRHGVWWYDLGAGGTWHQLAVTGPEPAVRADAALVLDPVRHQLVLFGGLDTLGSALRDVWALPLDGPPQWVPLTPTGALPAARHACAAVWDEAGGRMIVSCGLGTGAAALQDTWTLTTGAGPAWSQLTADSAPGGAAAGVYDRAGSRMIAFFAGAALQVEALSLGGAPGWSPVTTLRPAPGWAVGAPGIWASGIRWRAAVSPAFDPVNRAAAFLWDPTGAFGGMGPWPARVVTPVLRLEPVPQVHLTVDSLRAVFLRGSSISMHLAVDHPLYDSVTVARPGGTQVSIWPLVPDSGGWIRFGYDVLQAGKDYSYQLSWFDGLREQLENVPFVVHTPPPPVSIGLRLDTLYAAGRSVYVRYLVPSDSARMLCQELFQYSVDGGPWQVQWQGYPGDTIGLSLDNVAAGSTYSFRVVWGVPLVWYSEVFSIRVPPDPSWVGAKHTLKGTELRWHVPAGTTFSATLNRFPNGLWDQAAPVGTVRADTAGSILFRDTTATPGQTYIYYLTWKVGGVDIRDAGNAVAGLSPPRLWSLSATPSEVDAVWSMSAGEPWVAQVHRSAAPFSSETVLGTVQTDSSGALAVRDTAVVQGTVYRYGLTWPEAADGSTASPWVQIAVPYLHQSRPAWIAAQTRLDRVTLRWAVTPGMRFNGRVLRSLAAGPAPPVFLIGAVQADTSSGLISLTDTTVAPGQSYRYQLTWKSDGGDSSDVERLVVVPAYPTVLALGRPVPNPAQAVFSVDCSVPAGSAARLDVLDVAGRRVRTQWVPAPAVQRVPVSTAGLPTGIYLVRLTAGSTSRSARVAVVH